LQPALATMTGWWRDVLLAQHGCELHVTNIDQLASIQAAARLFSISEVRAVLERLERAPQDINSNANSRLLLETLLLHMPSSARSATITS
jgi:hypothetical protein